MALSAYHTVVWGLVASSGESAMNSWHRTDSGRLKESPTRQRPALRFDGSDHASKGGRTNHWGRIALRFGPADFRAHSTDGFGDDWPITYEELAPYYDKVESYIGVFGSKENVPNAPDGVFMPPPKPRCTETLVKKGMRQAEYHVYSIAAGHSDKAIERSRCVSLLRTVRPRLQNRFQLQFQPGNDSPGDEDGPPHDDRQRDGSRNRGGRQRKG